MPARRSLPMPAAWLALLLGGCIGAAAVLAADPAGHPETTKSRVLEAGAAALQTDAPPDSLDVYLVGFHPLKDDPEHQVEAHHFCRQVNEDLMQCALFDGNTAAASLTGIEYIISGRLFATLPAEEQRYWHPHNGEILSGQLVAPGLPDVAEKAMLRTKMNSYGKTWHTWDTSHGAAPGGSLPLGEPALAWSFSRLSEIRPDLQEARDRRMGIDTEAKRQERQDLVPLVHPQAGVDALKGRFSRPTQPIPGVVDRDADG
jgi:hypothetical protein